MTYAKEKNQLLILPDLVLNKSDQRHIIKGTYTTKYVLNIDLIFQGLSLFADLNVILPDDCGLYDIEAKVDEKHKRYIFFGQISFTSFCLDSPNNRISF